MILLIDNYDSFVYNLARYVRELGYECTVLRNDDPAITIFLSQTKPSHLIISPGPCTPNESGYSLQLIETLGQQIPVLGVCLGHQAIAQVFGGQVVKAKRPLHGQASFIWHEKSGLFAGLDNPLSVARYHSLIVSPDDFPAVLAVDAVSEEGEIMALHHKTLPIYGVQFHPESILTESGYELLHRFLEIN